MQIRRSPLASKLAALQHPRFLTRCLPAYVRLTAGLLLTLAAGFLLLIPHLTTEPAAITGNRQPLNADNTHNSLAVAGIESRPPAVDQALVHLAAGKPATATPTRTPTRLPTNTPTTTKTQPPTSTRTATATRTFTPAPTSTRTFTPAPTSTRTSTATRTPVNTATSTATKTSTPLPTATATATATGTNTPIPTSTISVVVVRSVRTANGSNLPQTIFNPGDDIHYLADVYNTTGAPQTVHFDWEYRGPCEFTGGYQINFETGTGSITWSRSNQIAAGACGGVYSYTFNLTYLGITSTQTSTYTVSGPTATPTSVTTPTPTPLPTDTPNPTASPTATPSPESSPTPIPTPGSVSLLAVWTGDENWEAKSAFLPGDEITFVAALYNASADPQAVLGDWELRGPCAFTRSYQITVTTGVGEWWHAPLFGPLSSDTCAGTYDYTFTLIYSGVTTTQSTTFTVTVPPTSTPTP